MTQPTKIAFAYRRVPQIDDITDIVQMLFPGNRNQQHAAARILLALKHAAELMPSLSFIENDYSISRRTLQQTRAKLSNLGLIEHVTWMNTRYGGRDGWKLSSRMSSALRQWAEKMDRWRNDKRPGRASKDGQLVELLP